MMNIATGKLFEKAYSQFCIPAINISNPEQVLALFKSADLYNSPIIVQVTPMAREYVPPSVLNHYIQVAAQLYPLVVYSYHLDHGYESHLEAALIEGNYNSIMIDASYDTLEDNIFRTKKITKAAHALSIEVEAELGVLGGKKMVPQGEDLPEKYTNPDDVIRFVSETHCDSLAIAIGTAHGAYKSGSNQNLQLHILKEIQSRLPNYPIVLHGASAIDPIEIARINAAGGKIDKSAKGIADDDLREAITLGVCKINIATDLRLLWTRVFREFFRDNEADFDHLDPGTTYMKELDTLFFNKFKLFNSIGKADLYKEG